MAYNPDIPQPSDDPSKSQDILLKNFQALNTFSSVNHIGLEDAGAGKHTFLQMPEQSSAPTTAANEGAMYAQESTLTGNTEMVFRRESNGSEVEFTGFLGAANGWTRLPSGILLKWGAFTAVGEKTELYPFGGTIPVFNAVYQAIVTVAAGGVPNNAATLQSFSKTSITAYGSFRTSTTAVSTGVKYLVIGS